MMKYFLIAILVTILVSSCRDSSTNPNSNHKIIPLELGNQWIYKIDSFDSIGINIVTSRFDTTKVTHFDNGWYSILNFSKFASTAKFQNRNDGFYVFNKVLGDNFAGLFFQYPTKKDNEYIVNASSSIIRNTKKRVETEFGIFNCIVYDYSPTNKGLNYDYHIFYLSSNVGIIREEYYKFKYPDKHILQERTSLGSKNF